MAKKELCEVNGRLVRLSEFAYQIASEKFGATKTKKTPKPIPVELLKPKVEPKEEPKVELIEAPDPLDVTLPDLEEVKTRKKPVRSRSKK